MPSGQFRGERRMTGCVWQTARWLSGIVAPRRGAMGGGRWVPALRSASSYGVIEVAAAPPRSGRRREAARGAGLEACFPADAVRRVEVVAQAWKPAFRADAVWMGGGERRRLGSLLSGLTRREWRRVGNFFWREIWRGGGNFVYLYFVFDENAKKFNRDK